MVRRDLIAPGALLALVTATSGCSRVFGLDSPHKRADASVVDDNTADAPWDAPMFDGQMCYGTALLSICPATEPTGTIDINSDIDTGADARCSSEVSAHCAIMADIVSVSQNIVVTGPRPLVLLGVSSVTINVFVDVGSRRLLDGGGNVIGDKVGPGEGSQADCGVAPAGAADANGAGGGAGGSFGGKGGNGAVGDGGAGGVGGVALAASGAPTNVRGGCRGGTGGMGTDPGGGGGHGGGAVYIISELIQIGPNGVILAGGQGGYGGDLKAGGGGGGSGGLIGLDAPTISCVGRLSANGGGGGEGGGGADGPGDHGLSSSDPQNAPDGGAGNAQGGDGGDGSYGLVIDGQAGGIDSDGGGGGGGGAGFIKLYPPRSLGGNCGVSPPTS